MIFGKTFLEKQQSKQEYLKHIKNNGIKKFAWLPKTLKDGRKIWLQKYYVFYMILKSQYNDEYILWDKHPRIFLTQKEGQDAIY